MKFRLVRAATAALIGSVMFDGAVGGRAAMTLERADARDAGPLIARFAARERAVARG